MDPDAYGRRWAEADALFSAALDLQPAQRQQFVARETAADPGLRAAVLALLAAADTADSFLAEGGAVLPGHLIPELIEELEVRQGSLVGKRIGRYRLIREVGRGGTGTVFLAERDDGAFQQRVAIKLLRRGVDTDDVLARFRAERQILASLSHPSIARLLDGGATPDGRPYLVMELVEGQPITRYCDERRLSIEQRLALFETVADAVQHAHRKLIVHRDLKPSNILVTPDGSPKLLDFGIAKLLGPVDADTDAPTRTGIRPMTPAYASPEQVRGETITTSSDVYQLGLLLYELLTGQRPAGRRSGSSPDVERALERNDLVQPSAAAARPTAPRGLGGPRSLRRRLRGDLDTIVLKALHADPERRYESVADLTGDIRRHLTGHPVRARPDARAYRARRFLARRRGPVAAGLLFVMLAGAYGIQLRRERDTAMVERARAEQVSAFLIDMFKSADLGRADRADTLTARTLLERGARRIQESLHDQPEVRAHLLTVIGRAHNHLDGSGESFDLLEEALRLRTGLYGPLDDRTAETLEALATARARAFHHTAADSLFRQAVELRRDQSPIDTIRLAGATRRLAESKRNLGQLDSAEIYIREALELLESAGILDGPDHLRVLHSLALILRSLGELDAAEETYRGVLAAQRSAGPDERRGSAATANNLAYLLVLRGAYAEAELLYREAMGLARETYGDGHTRTRDAMGNLGALMRRQARWAEAAELAGEGLVLDLDIWGPDSWQAAQSIGRLGRIQLEAGDGAAAEPYFRDSLRIYAAALGPDHSWTGGSRLRLAAAFTAQRRYAEAEVELLDALARTESVEGDENTAPLRRGLVEALVDVYDAWDKPAAAQRYRAILD
jgi:eukaryotic-like serine/threonine-protein kinase